jgi:hypothetical protein
VLLAKNAESSHLGQVYTVGLPANGLALLSCEIAYQDLQQQLLLP